VRYNIDGSEAGQSMTQWIHRYAGSPAPAAGLTFIDQSQSVRPGAHYQFRATALASDGSVLATSPLVTVDAPAQYPQITNLTATVGPLQMAPLMIDGTTQLSHTVTWTWDPIPGQQNAIATWDFIVTDPVSNQTTTTRHGQSFWIIPGFSGAYQPGTTVRICVSGLLDPFVGKPLAGAPCLDTPIPARAP